MERPPPATASSSVRVLSRTSPTPSASSSPTATSPSNDGVVTVGFVGGGGSARLADRILDATVFSAGGSARLLAGGVRYHRDADRRMVFLHLAPPPPSEEGGGGELRELLFMFSVCHVIIFLHEGFRFNTQILKKFRLLQSSKHALAPFVRSLVAPVMSSKVPPSRMSMRIAHRDSSISPPAHRGGPTGRQPSSISLMSGTGSHPSVLPGQCIPVVLFVFEDDIFDGPSPATSLDDMGDSSSVSQASSTDGLPKPNLALKGSGSVVMLARPMNRSDGNLRKKLHSSLEGQIRFLLRKCRTLVGVEQGHIGPRGVSNVSHLPLFSLDTSRVVAFLDRLMDQKGEPLDIITGLIDESLSSNLAIDILSPENNSQPTNHEDVLSIKDFIFRQCDMLRGRGGHSSNATSGSTAGVGMVAAAAAAAAASAAAGKPVSAPDLPSFDKWLSVSTSILVALLTAGKGMNGDSGNNEESSTQTGGKDSTEQLPSAGCNAVEAALSCLESSKGMNMKFSLSWCQRALPAAKDVYLKDLPAFYPTSMHEVQLQKAMQSFRSMVKGPAVQVFSKKLEDECRTIWESGRQQCDAVSLTGKQCKHKRHGKTSPSDATEQQHSSGYVFLHACACGRSRRLRDDPFDFKVANISFNCFSNCEDLLPTLVLPRQSDEGSFPISSWRLMRLGGARYYKSTKGLLQTGFCSKEKHLLRWTISLGRNGKNCIRATTKPSSLRSSMDAQTPSLVIGQVKSLTAQVTPEIKPARSENSRKQPEVESVNNSGISFGKGLPNFTMKKPFAEVVAGTTTKDSEFPALQQKRPPKPGTRKDDRQVGVADQTNNRGHAALNQGPRAENDSEKVSTNKTNSDADGKPFLKIGSNIVPVIIGNESKEASQTLQQFVIYVGFEHECSYGHRFLLSNKHLKELDSSYSQNGRSHPFNNETESKNGSQKLLHNSSGLTTMVAVNNVAKGTRPGEPSGRNSQQHSLQPRVDADKLLPAHQLSTPGNDRKGQDALQRITLDDGGEAFSLLNRNLPIYMCCPHCRSSDRKGHQDVKFAGAISQLQRIFIVTPDFPLLLASCPVVQFEDSCLPLNVSNREEQALFSLRCRVVLPPESFLTMRLPFVYGVETSDGSTLPLNHSEHQPELTAWLVGGTALQVVSAGHVVDEETSVQ